MSESVFLELRSDLPQTVYISETSTAGRELTIRPTLDRQLTRSGYTLVDAPDEATYLIQINHLRLAESELTGDEILDDAITSALIAGGAAALVTDVLGASDVAVVGVGLGVGALGFILDAKTKHIAHTLTTDVLVTESVPVNGAERELRYHKTQIVSGASKVNLKLEESLPAMINGLSRSLAGLLPNERWQSPADRDWPDLKAQIGREAAVRDSLEKKRQDRLEARRRAGLPDE